MSNSMFSAAFDVLIKILESYRPQIPSLRKINHSQQQQNTRLHLIHQFEKLSIREMNQESLSKILEESVDEKGITFPPLPFIY